MIPLGPVVARSRVKASRVDTWSYLVEADLRSEWWPELHLDPEVGGTVVEQWSEGSGDESVSRDAAGKVDVWVEGHAIGFTWREAGDDRDTAVLLTLRTQSGGTGITITETGFDALPTPAERAAASQEGWKVLLGDLAAAIDAAVESGSLSPATAVGAAAAVGAVAVAAAGAVADSDADSGMEAGAAPSAGAGDGADDPGDEAADPDPGAASTDGVDSSVDDGVVDDSVDSSVDDGVAEDGVAAGTLDTVPVVVEGEMVDPPADEEEIVLDPEPELGDHLELDTGAVSVVPNEVGEPNEPDEVLEPDEAHDADESRGSDESTGSEETDDADDLGGSEKPGEPEESDEPGDAETAVAPDELGDADAHTRAAEGFGEAQNDEPGGPGEPQPGSHGGADDDSDAVARRAPEAGDDAANDTATEEASDDDESTGDPDFDDLIRGLI